MSEKKLQFDELTKRGNLNQFAQIILQMQKSLDYRVSSRGWGYLLEQAGYINKDQFDQVEKAINNCRKDGIIPVDFVADEDARAFSGVETPSRGTMRSTIARMLDDVLTGHDYFSPDWLKDEKYYVQVVVEKTDLKTLFESVCRDYHIPIGNAKGWSSILQRAEYCKRFAFAERRGLKCVLLYCGDHDPDGLRISETLRNNLKQVSAVIWKDGMKGYDPRNLIIERFGLNYDFIQAQNYSWIDNLITGSGKNLADPAHRNYKLQYVQDYLRKIGERKCEANAVITTPDVARKMMRDAIEKYLGKDARSRFEAKRERIEKKYLHELELLGIRDEIESAKQILEDDPRDDPDFDPDIFGGNAKPMPACPECEENKDVIIDADGVDGEDFFCEGCDHAFELDEAFRPPCPQCLETRNVRESDLNAPTRFYCDYCERGFDEGDSMDDEDESLPEDHPDYFDDED